MTDVDREMLRHLRAYRAATRPSDGQRDGALQGLLQRVRAGDEVDMDLAAPRPVLAAASRMRWVIAAASVAALLGGGALLVAAPTGVEPSQPSSSAALYGGDVEDVTHEVVEVAPPPAPKRAPKRSSSVGPERPPAAVVPVPEPPKPALRRAPPRPKPVPAIAIEPSIDAAEVAALRRAQAELASAPADALARIVEHTKTYPSSSLAAERDVARATALCNLGRVDEARAAVAAFEQRRPGSPLLPRMRRICSDSIASRDGSTGSPH